jgi:hypothetical protein
MAASRPVTHWHSAALSLINDTCRRRYPLKQSIPAAHFSVTVIRMFLNPD